MTTQSPLILNQYLLLKPWSDAVLSAVFITTLQPNIDVYPIMLICLNCYKYKSMILLELGFLIYRPAFKQTVAWRDHLKITTHKLISYFKNKWIQWTQTELHDMLGKSSIITINYHVNLYSLSIEGSQSTAAQTKICQPLIKGKLRMWGSHLIVCSLRRLWQFSLQHCYFRWYC